MLPGIMLISNIRENGEPIGALPDGEMMFHHDMIHSEVPSKATLLYSVEIPSTGGNTLFASGYAAYDTLDPAIRNKLEGRKAHAPLQLRLGAEGRRQGHRVVRRMHASGLPHQRGHRPQGGLRQPADDGRRRRHAAGGEPSRCSTRCSTTPRSTSSSTSTSGGSAISCSGTTAAPRTRAPIFRSTERRLMLRTTVKGTVRPY